MKNNYKVCKDFTEIYINRKDGLRLVVLIDNEDLQNLINFGYSWCSIYSKENDAHYALTYILDKNSGREKALRMHRFILNYYGDYGVDHINHNTLDNRKENLRIADCILNGQNLKLCKRNTSGCRGVCWNKSRNKWKAIVRIKGKAVFQRDFTYKDDAIKAVKMARAKYMPYSQEARELNF